MLNIFKLKNTNKLLVSFIILLVALNLYLIVKISKQQFNLYNYKSTTLKEMTDSLKMKESFIKYYIEKSIHNYNLLGNEIVKLNLIDENSNYIKINDLYSGNEMLIIFFPPNACPTCYNLDAFQVLKEIKNIKVLVITPIDRFVDIKWFFNRKNINATFLAFENEKGFQLFDLEDPCMCVWNNKTNTNKYLWFFPKQVYKNLIRYYLDSILLGESLLKN